MSVIVTDADGLGAICYNVSCYSIIAVIAASYENIKDPLKNTALLAYFSFHKSVASTCFTM